MLSRWQSTIVDERGNVQPLANLTVRNEADQSLAKMWASPGTSQPLPDGMLQADGNGYAYFYAEGGMYRITSATLGIDWRHVPLGELAGMDVADLGLGTAAFADIEVGEGDSDADVMSQKAITDAINTRSASLRENIKVTVGAGGDFPTINAAVLHLSRFTPDLGVTAEVELQSGFVMAEQLFVEGLDLGWITITGVDAETVINEPSLTRVLMSVEDANFKPAFGVISGTLPTIGQLFRFSSKGSTVDFRSGVTAYSLGKANILNGCGVKNAGCRGIEAGQGSTINAAGAVVSGAGLDGISAWRGSTINALGVNASGAGSPGTELEFAL